MSNLASDMHGHTIERRIHRRQQPRNVILAAPPGTDEVTSWLVPCQS